VEKGFAQDRGQRNAAGCYISSNVISQKMLFFRITKVQRAGELYDKYKRIATNSIRAFLVISDVVLKTVAING
jgi:hypothetical protein